MVINPDLRIFVLKINNLQKHLSMTINLFPRVRPMSEDCWKDQSDVHSHMLCDVHTHTQYVPRIGKWWCRKWCLCLSIGPKKGSSQPCGDKPSQRPAIGVEEIDFYWNRIFFLNSTCFPNPLHWRRIRKTCMEHMISCIKSVKVRILTLEESLVL